MKGMYCTLPYPDNPCHLFSSDFAVLRWVGLELTPYYVAQATFKLILVLLVSVFRMLEL